MNAMNAKAPKTSKTSKTSNTCGNFNPLRLALCATLLAFPLISSAEKKEYKYSAPAGSTVSIINQRGTITVKPANGRQVIISANPASDKVEVDASQSGSRINLRTHSVNKANGNEGNVDYDVQLPPDTSITIDSGSGDIRVENVRGNVTVDSEEGQVEIRGVTGGFVQVQSVNGGITVQNVQKGRVQLTSMGGNLQLNGVSGSNVSAKSTTGSITFNGDFAGGGDYLLANHSGDISVTLPASASIDLTARSIQGSVENDFPLQKPAHTSFQLKEGKAIAGTSNSGASSVELRSFSGKIRVKKQ
jgi:DUF4097 and DUF4098 domain-containing protein YvlB